jgi:beta-galactosidase/beta-glucuronidase
MTTPRSEYPRPHFKRQEWLNLNGQWDFAFDDSNVGLDEKWFLQHDFSETIMVPFAFQTKLSGIEKTEFHDIVWYRRSFSIPTEWDGNGIILHFGAVDYRAVVWVNGFFVTSHEGGHTPFYADITSVLKEGENYVVVRAEDLSTDLEQPRGKQFWEEKSKDIFYTRTTGIWQTVWLEPVGSNYVERVMLTPNIDKGEITVDYTANKASPSQRFEIEVSINGNIVATDSDVVHPFQKKSSRTLQLTDFEKGEGKLWSPESPNLYDIVFRLKEEDQLLDEATGYFGMRKISIEEGRVMLNNARYYMKLVLDQGYYPESLITAPNDEAIKTDVIITKEMGFNGVRKHQKVEEPRYLYWADKLGLLVWGEMANCHTFTDQSIKRITAEWQSVVERDYNHPSIIVWVPLNESWGVPGLKTDVRQPYHALSLYYLTKSIDSTRPVIANDGWEHLKSDILSIHDYEGQKEIVEKRYSTIENILNFKPGERDLYISGFAYDGAPIFISEFGGIAFKKSGWKGWGYTSASDDEDFVRRYSDVVSSMLKSPLVQGFCYTQLTDVEQEINGLLTYERKLKIDPKIIREINEGKPLKYS